MKPDSAPTPLAAGRSAEQCTHGGLVSAFRPVLENQVHCEHRELHSLCGRESKRMFGAQGDVSCLVAPVIVGALQEEWKEERLLLVGGRWCSKGVLFLITYLQH